MESLHLSLKAKDFFKVSCRAPTQKFSLPESHEKGIDLFIKRLDLAHQPIGGNKYYKLKYNLQRAQAEGAEMLITFGGAYSNHILALAQAGDLLRCPTLGLIRGEELGKDLSKTLLNNPTLAAASRLGMRFEFLERTTYRFKESLSFIKALQRRYPKAYIIPEGGTNSRAIKGCQEILDEKDRIYDYIAIPMGTGGTFCGVLKGLSQNQLLLGFPALKNLSFFLENKINSCTSKKNYAIINRYQFGGYAKISDELINFMNFFKQKNAIPLDPVYTSKMMFGLSDMIRKDVFPHGARVLVLHTGGLQGIAAMNERLKKTNHPLIS